MFKTTIFQVMDVMGCAMEYNLEQLQRVKFYFSLIQFKIVINNR